MSDKKQTKKKSPTPPSISKFLYSTTKIFHLNFNIQGLLEGKYSLSQQTLFALMAHDHSSNQKAADI